jgi:hypothetical protein
MSGNALNVTIGADVTDLRTKLALAQADVKAFSGETRNLAQEMRSASDSARAQLLPQLQAASKAAADSKASVNALTREIAANSNEHRGLAGIMSGQSRAAFMEFEHSARASADALAAGADPMRVLAMEAPRVVQALTELGPGAMAGLLSPTTAAIAGVAALTAGLGYLAYQAISAQHALEDAKTAMLFAGNLNAGGIQAYNADIEKLIANFGLGKSEATEAAIAISGIKGPAAAYREQILSIAAEYAALKKTDLKTSLDEVMKAANGGTESFLKWADQVGIVTQAQKDLIAGAGHDELAAFGTVVDIIAGSWGKVADGIAKARKEQEDYNRLAEVYAAAGVQAPSPDELGMHVPTAEELHPTKGPSAPDPKAEQAAKIAATYNKTLLERTGILRDIQILETALANEADPAKRTQDEGALSELRLKAVHLHTAAENEAWQQQIGHIKQEAAAAKEGSAEKIAALRQEAEAIRQRNTLSDDQGKITFDGKASQEYQEAEARVAEAVRSNEEKNRTEYDRTIAKMEEVASSALRMSEAMSKVSTDIAASSREANRSIDRSLAELNKTFDRNNREIAKGMDEVARETEKPWTDASHAIGQSFNSSITGIITGSQTLQQAEQSIAQSIVGSFANAALRTAEDWISSQIRQLVVTEATEEAKVAAKVAGTTEAKAVGAAAGSASVVHDAYEGAAAAYKAVVGIPVIGPILAPPAAALAFAGIMAFDTFSAEGGFDIPRGVNPMVQLHQREMVIPAPYADVIRGMAANSNGGGTGAGGSGGGTHNHHYNVTVNAGGANMSKSEFRSEVVSAIKQAHRGGELAGARR